MQPVVNLSKKKNYLTRIRNAAAGENRMFRNLYATVDGVEQDISGDGALACAIFVSSILYLQNSQGPKLIDFVHSSVMGTEKDLLKNRWTLTDQLHEGAIIVWEHVQGRETPGIGNMHGHIGFFIGGEKAISNDGDGRGIPVEHHYTYDGKRKIEKIYWHPALDEN